MKNLKKIGTTIGVGILGYMSYFYITQLHEAYMEDLFLSTPDPLYNKETPVKSGNHQPLPLPNVYRKTAPIITAHLDDILEEKKYMDEQITLFPLDRSITESKYVFGYFTGENCPNCLYLDKIGTKKSLEESIQKENDTVLATFYRKSEGKNPSLFTRLEGIPVLALYQIHKGDLNLIGEVDPRDWSKAKENAQALLHARRTLTSSLVELTDEDFRHYTMGFPINSPEPNMDSLAILEAIARFGKAGINYNEQNNELLISLDLDIPQHFWFARAYDESPTLQGKNRGVLTDIQSQAIKYSLQEQERNKQYSKIGRWIDTKQKIILGTKEMNLSHAERHNLFKKQFHDYANGCFPPYIDQRYHNAVLFAQRLFHGQSEHMNYVAGYTSKKVREEIEQWASSKNISVERRALPAEEELRSLSVPLPVIEHLVQARKKLEDTFSFLEQQNIITTDPWVPAEPILNLLEKSKEAIILRGGPNDDFSTSISLIKEMQEVQHEYNLLEQLVSIAQKNRFREGTVILYLPHVPTSLGFTSAPGVTTHAMTDRFAHWDYGSALLLYTLGTLSQNVSELPNPSQIYYAHEAELTSRIKRGIEQLRK